MNNYLFIAGLLCFILGVVHSFLGEYLIFKDKRNKGRLIPSKNSNELKERHLRILWATWHLASVFGWCIGAILIKIAVLESQQNTEITCYILNAIHYTMFISSALVAVGTKGKHPGWIVLLAIGLLVFIGN